MKFSFHSARRASVVALAALLVLGAGRAVAQDKDEVSRKLTRQMAVMENIIDQVLIDSPNFLVSGRGNARGIYLDEFGVLFTFRASLVEKDFDFDWGGTHGMRILKDDDGKILVIGGDENDDEYWGDEDEDGNSKDKDKRSRRFSFGDRKRDGQAKLYRRGKQEIIDTLLDYGDTMTSVGDDQWLAIAAYLQDSDFFQEEKISRLIFKARMKDIRSYADGKITEEAMIAKIVESEY